MLVEQDTNPRQETSVGVMLPVLPMNNKIQVRFRASSKTSLNPAVQSSGLSLKSENAGISEDYPFRISVYIRQKSYPYNILSTSKQNITIGKNGTNPQSVNVRLNLELELVQDDLANAAELVFDFSESVKATTAYQALTNAEYFTPDDQSRSAQSKKPWYWSQIKIEDFQAKAICDNPIYNSDLQKYQATLLALRSNKIKERYNKVTNYRIDSESEKRVGKYNIWLPIVITVWLCTMAFCGYKLYKFKKNIKELKF